MSKRLTELVGQLDTDGQKASILSYEGFRQLARPTSSHIDENEVNAYIRECEDIYVVPAIGWQNYKAAMNGSSWDDTFDDTFNGAIFLDGGEYEQQDECNDKTVLQYCNGLRKAVAYFVYARMLRADGTIVSRAGAMRHRDEYGDHVDNSNNKQYSDVMQLAEKYLANCMAYYKYHQLTNVNPVHSSRGRIVAIGD